MDSGPGVFDHELDSEPRRPVRPIGDSIEFYQRLIVNPFLAVLALIVAFAIGRWAAANEPFGFYQVYLVFLAAKFLVQFHCRDCGATGFLFRSKKHTCPPVLARWHMHKLPRFRGPNVRMQYVGWLILIASVAIVLLITRLGT